MFHPNGPTFMELAHQALSSTERGYDLLAPKFDYTPFRTPDWILELVGSYLQHVGSLGSGLDLCCGTGAGVQYARYLGHEARLVALKNMAEGAEANYHVEFCVKRQCQNVAANQVHTASRFRRQLLVAHSEHPATEIDANHAFMTKWPQHFRRSAG